MILYLTEWLLLYPASGFRNSGSGSFSSIGTGGWCWDSVVSTFSGTLLHFTAAAVYPLHTNDRARGLVVRCVQHLLFLLKIMCSLT